MLNCAGKRFEWSLRLEKCHTNIARLPFYQSKREQPTEWYLGQTVILTFSGHNRPTYHDYKHSTAKLKTLNRFAINAAE